MLKCAIFADFLDFEMTAADILTQLHAREGKTHGFFAFLLKNRHYFIGLNTSLSYIRMVMGEDFMLTCGILAEFIDFENGCCYLNTIARKRRKTYGFLAFLLKNIHYFIGLNTSLFYMRMVMGKNYLEIC